MNRETIKVGFVSLGCPKNEIDCELMLARVHAAGFTVTAQETEADVVIVNTCAFIQSAKEEAIEAILDLQWLRDNRDLRGIIVTGCLAQRYYEEILSTLPEVDAVLSLGGEQEICAAIEAVMQGERYDRHGAPEALVIEGDRILTGPSHTAFLKLAEGCDNRCSYCAIPLIRGRFRSRSEESILEEAKTLYALGVKELCLCAQDTTRYGLDTCGEYRLAALLEKLCTARDFSFQRIRLMYCYPDKITDELLAVMAAHEAVVPYIDLPIQHASERILAAMNRHGGRAVCEDAIARLRRAVPGIAVRTTVMVGFPGETEAEFKELLDFVKAQRFERLGAFAFSAEEGTAAASLPGAISEEIKQERLDNLMRAQYTIHTEYHKSLVGKTLRVLCEGYDIPAGCYAGRSDTQAPEIDGCVFFSSERKLSEGEFVFVKITETMEYDLFGEAVKGSELG